MTGVWYSDFALSFPVKRIFLNRLPFQEMRDFLNSVPPAWRASGFFLHLPVKFSMWLGARFC